VAPHRAGRNPRKGFALIGGEREWRILFSWLTRCSKQQRQ